MADQVNILQKFKSTLVSFLDDLSEQVDGHDEVKGNLITLRIFVQDQMPITDIINNFILHILPEKERIQKKDDVYFMTKKNFFTSIKPETVESFKKLWRSNLFDDEDRAAIWKWVDTFVILAEKYQSTIC